MRLRAGGRRKAEGGGFIGGAPLFGYRLKAGEIVADESEQRAIARIRTLRSKGASLRTIARTLDAEGSVQSAPPGGTRRRCPQSSRAMGREGRHMRAVANMILERLNLM